jgi:Raf kinase inhibitor-like YbhB/YbcL family protein
MSPVRIRPSAQVKRIFLLVILIITFLFLFGVKSKNVSMKIISSAFENNAKIPSKYTCDGRNINPPLSFADVPQNAKSLVLIVDDPDAPGGTWLHWTVFNIDPKINEVLENSLPKSGIEGVTSFAKTGYGGPCPPSGTHRYFFKLYALDATLGIKNPDKATLEKEMQEHIVDKAELIGLYSRI